MQATHGKLHRRIREELASWQASRGNETPLRELVIIDPPDIEALIRICSDRKRPPEMRRIAAVVLGRLRARKAVDVLISNMWEDQPDLALSSGAALGTIRSRGATGHLLCILRECPFPASREAAAMVFKELKDGRAIGALERTLLDSGELSRVRFQAGAALAGWKPDRTLPAFLKASSDESAEVRYISAYALGLSGRDDRAVAALERLVSDKGADPSGSTVGEQATESLDMRSPQKRSRQLTKE
jgi:HEAT repeat protein